MNKRLYRSKSSRVKQSLSGINKALAILAATVIVLVVCSLIYI